MTRKPIHQQTKTTCKPFYHMPIFTITWMLTCILQALCSVPCINHMFTQQPALANVVYSDYLLFESTARSVLDCSGVCTLNTCCVSFTFHTFGDVSGMCRGHSATGLLGQGNATSEAGAMTFFMKPFSLENGSCGEVAAFKSASQSSMYNGVFHNASLVVDRILETYYPYCTDTEKIAGVRSWWQVDLLSPHHIFSVFITNKLDALQRLRDFDIYVFLEDPVTNTGATSTLCRHYDGPMANNVTEEIKCCHPPISGRVVRITNTENEYLTLCEVQVMALPAIQASGVAIAPPSRKTVPR